MLAILFGFFLGISLAAPPGPMNALIAREAAVRWTRGVRIGMGAPVADVVWLAVMFFGLGALFAGEAVLQGAASLGAVVMAVFSYQTWEQRDPRAAERPATFWAGFLAAMTNPFQAAWWLSGGYVFVQSQGVAAIPGFLVGIFGWVITFSWLVGHGASRWHWFIPAIRWFSTMLLAGFSIVLAAVAMGIVSL